MGLTDSPDEIILLRRLTDLVRASPTLMQVLTTVRDLNPPDWRIVSGAIYQTVWNALTGRPPDHGIKDYDVVYFDPDTSWDAEDAVIRRVAAAFPAELAAKVEVRNQARVHLWFEAKFNEPYPPLTCTDEALVRFVAPAFAVGVRLENDGELDVVAPFGLKDCFAMQVRPNPALPTNPVNFRAAAERLTARWPEASVEFDA